MPLVILCGFPVSGKSLRAAELKKYIIDKFPQRTVQVVSDDLTLNVKRNEVYVSSHLEKEVRGGLKSAVQRLLNKDDVVILDSLNYIKGFRYELYCLSKSCHSTQCVVFCDASKEVVSARNQCREKREGQAETYNSDVLDGLIMRFEPPSTSNRWDSPLFVVQAEDVLPSETICASLFDKQAPKPNQSTQSQPLSSTNFLYELDKETQNVVSRILDAQKTGAPGDVIFIPGTKEQLMLTRTLTLSELQRHKRQFIAYTKMHPVADTARLTGLFTQYLRNAMS